MSERPIQREGGVYGPSNVRMTPAQSSKTPPIKTSLRGYGSKHQRTRRMFKPLVESGSVLCGRCGQLIHPGEPWDLGHADDDRSRYTGPEHRRCNRATAGRRRKTSRQW